MKSVKIISALLLAILFVQLSVIDILPQTFYNNFSYGNFSVIQTKEQLAYNFKQVFYETFNSTALEDEHESVVLVGDVMLARNVEFLMTENDSKYPFAGLDLSVLAPEPAVVGNFEAAMAVKHKITPANQLSFSVNPSALTALSGAGFTHLSLANNHSYDYGESGFLNTLNSLQSQNVQAFGSEKRVGTSSVSIIKTNKGDIALIGINASDGRLKIEDVLKTMDYASTISDLQIVYIHWGIEYEKIHDPAQEKLALELVHAGADLIVGHHPHVVQDIAVIEGVPVFYSLGNYIFDQYFATNVQEGLVLVLELQETTQIHLVPVSSLESKSQPSIMKPAQYAAFLNELATKSDPALYESILKGVVPLRSKVATSSKMAMIN